MPYQMWPTYPYSAIPYPLSTSTSQCSYQQGQMQQPTQPQNSILTVFVSSEEEVNLYPVAAGVTVLLVSFNLGKFYLKSTAKNGVPEVLRVFDFTEVTQNVQPNQNDDIFVRKKDFDEISNRLNALIEKLGGDK